METPKRICLIDAGDEVVWCDSVPSDDIEDSDVVWYTRTPPATDKLIAAAIGTRIVEIVEIAKATHGVMCKCYECNDLVDLVDDYQKEQEQ